MFQRIRGAIDRTIAEEQARQKTLDPGASPAPSRTASTSRKRNPAGKQSGASAEPPEAGAAPNPDPAVFEAAFVIDDSDELSRAGTPKPPSTQPAEDTDRSAEDGSKPPPTTSDVEPQASKEQATDEPAQSSKTQQTSTGAATETQEAKTEAMAGPPAQMTPEIRQKLRKLEKLEATYPGLCLPALSSTRAKS
jgi:hypothetical protein